MWLPACLEPCVLAGSCPWLVWLPACLEPRVLCWCVPGSCWLVRAGWKWLPAYLEPRVPGWCPGWFVLVGSGYLHALNLVSLLVRALPWKGIINSTYTNN